MADRVSPTGSAIFKLNTRRPPDLSLTGGLPPLSLRLPDSIGREVTAWHQNLRRSYTPKDAVQALKKLPVTAYLNGDPQAWLTIPGVAPLARVWRVLEPPNGQVWPTDIPALRNLASGELGLQNAASLIDELRKQGTIGLLNDLILVFKFATLNQDRPLRLVSNLYRLASALAASDSEANAHPLPAEWLTAPLEFPQVFTVPLRRLVGSGPEPDHHIDPAPILPAYDLASPTAIAMLADLDVDLANLQRTEASMLGAQMVTSSGGRTIFGFPWPFRRVSTDSSTATRAEALRRELTRPKAPVRSSSSRLASVRIAGLPILLDVSEAQRRIANTNRRTATALRALLARTTLDRLDALRIDVTDLLIWGRLPVAVRREPSRLRPSGRSDLLVVRQITTGYRRSEIAYIENILVGETRQRNHTLRVLSRAETFFGADSETEESRDLQVTDRADLSRETSDVVEEDLAASGNVQVTSRGPTVDVAVTAEATYGRSTEESAKAAEKYGREVIDRAVLRTLTRTRQEARNLFEQEMIEANQHGFAADAREDHVVGVYQYLERVSQAKIYCYGRRELYDILLPEPAALLWRLAVRNHDAGVSIRPPDEELFSTLTLDNIAAKRQQIISAYSIADLPPLPEEQVQLQVPFAATGANSDDDSVFTMNKEVQVAEGYAVTGAVMVIGSEWDDEDVNELNGTISVGSEIRTFLGHEVGTNRSRAQVNVTFDPPLAGRTIGIALNVDNFRSISGNVTVTTELTATGRTAWQLAAYGIIAARVNRMRQEYEQALRETEAFVPEGPLMPEGSRSMLANIVRTELQRGAIEIMRNNPLNFDLVSDVFVPADGEFAHEEYHPTTDMGALATAGSEIQFLQQAFEWEHLAWVLYPYFWGRRNQWAKVSLPSVPDPDFAAFLSAGSARLQIAVRPGFEVLVKHFMETSEVYGGDGLPSMGDSGYLPFVEEQAAAQGEPGDEAPWPAENPRQWEVIAPTPLVLVRSLAISTLPSWDPVTGDERPQADSPAVDDTDN